jgi:hypothetical protein
VCFISADNMAPIRDGLFTALFGGVRISRASDGRPAQVLSVRSPSRLQELEEQQVFCCPRCYWDSLPSSDRNGHRTDILCFCKKCEMERSKSRD